MTWDWRNDPVVEPVATAEPEWDWQSDPVVEAPATAQAEPPKPADPKLLANLQEIERQRNDPELGRTLKAFDRFRYMQGLVPFMGDAIEAGANIQAIHALNRINSGAGSEEDYAIAASFIDQQQRDAKKAEKATILGKAGDVLAHLPKYGAEFALTGGAFSSGKAVAAEGLKLGIGGAAKSAAGRLAANAAGVAAQTAVNPAMIAANASRRMVPDIDVQRDDAGAIQGANVGESDGFLESLAPAYLDTMIELGSERAGGAIVGALGRVPGVKQVSEAVKRGVIGRWLSKPGRTPQMFDEALKQSGWNGMLGEVLEERAGDVVRLSTGLESPDQNVVGQLVTGNFKEAFEQLAVEGLAFSVPGAVSVASRAGQRRQDIEPEAPPVQVPPEVPDAPIEPPVARDPRWRYSNGGTQPADPQLADTTVQNFNDSTPAGTDPADASTLEAFPVAPPDRQAELAALSVPQLKAIAKDMGLGQSLNKGKLVKDILEAEQKAIEQPAMEEQSPERTQILEPIGALEPQSIATPNSEGAQTEPEFVRGTEPPTNQPPIVQFRKDAAEIEASLPPPEPGTVRLWRGNRKGEVGQNPQFTNDLPGIALPFQKAYGGDLSYVDVPEADVPKYLQTSGVAKDAEFVVPPELAQTAKTVSPQPPVSLPSEQPPPVSAAPLNQEAIPNEADIQDQNSVNVGQTSGQPLGDDGTQAPAVEAPPVVKPARKPTLKERAAQARQEVHDAADDLKKYLQGRVYSGVDPELVRRVGVLVAKSVKAGTLTFADFVADVTTMLGESQVRDLRSTFASEWNKAADGSDKLDRAAEEEGDSPLTSIKNAVVNELRAKRGVAELPEVPPQSLQEWLDAATDRIQGDPTWPSRLVEELIASPRNLSNVEVAGLQLYYRRLHNEFEVASDKLFASQDDPAAKAQAQTEADLLSDQLLRTEAATKAAGRAWGQSGMARQTMLAQDYSLAGLTRRARVALGGAQLTEEQQSEVKKLADRVAELEVELAKQMEARQQEQQSRVIQQQIDEDKKAAKPARLRKVSARKAAVLKKIEDAWTEFTGLVANTAFSTPVHLIAPAAKIIKGYVELGIVSFSEFMAHAKHKLGERADAMRPTFQAVWDDLKTKGEIPEITADQDDVRAVSRLAREVQRSLVEAGITEREAVVDGVHEALQEFMPEISRRQTMDALSGYGQFSTLSKDATDAIVRDINGQLQQLAKLDDMQKGDAPKKTGQERRTPSDEERRLIKQVNEAKKRGGFDITDRESQLRSSLDAAKRAMRNRIADLTHEIKTKERIVAKKNELKADEELTKLRTQRDELLKEHRKLFPPQGATTEQKLAAASKAIDRAIAQIEGDLREGRIGLRPKPQPLQSPELDAKRARLNALRAQRDELRAQHPEEWALKAYKRSLEKRIADYVSRMASGDFAKQEKKSLAFDQKAMELRHRLNETKMEFQDKKEAWRRSKLPPVQKALDLTQQTLLASRAILTSLDLSAVFRQGGFASFSHPILAFKAMLPSLGAAASRSWAFAEAEGLRNRPNAQLYDTAKLALTETSGPMSRQEETYAGRWAQRIPGVAASERAYVAFLSRLRADVFDSMLASLGSNSPASLDEAKVIADFVNTATGRGSLGKFSAAGNALTTVFFAPRYVVSRFQLLARPATLPFENTSGRVKAAVAKEYGRYLVGLGLMYGLAYMLLDGGDDETPLIELDPRSSDFGKIRLGETRIDPLSGLSQSIVLLSKLASGQTKSSSTGNVTDIRGPNVKFGQPTSTDAIGRFLRSKLSPVFSSAVDIVSGEDFVGQPVTPASALTDAVVPLSFRDVLDTMRAQGVPAGTALALVSLLGIGVSTYGPETEQRRKLAQN